VPDWVIVGLNYAAWLVLSGGWPLCCCAIDDETITPLLWLLFQRRGDGRRAPLPVHLFLTGLAFPLGWLEPPATRPSTPPDTSGDTTLPLRPHLLAPLHWAHRFRYTLYDGLQLKHLTELIAVLCYGAALLGTAMTA